MTARMPSGQLGSFERVAWDALVDVYERHFGPVLERVHPAILANAFVDASEPRLDVAAGPGTISAKLVDHRGGIVALDITEAMLRSIRRRHAGIGTCRGDAALLPFADRSFCTAFSNFGVAHFPDPDQVVAEMASVVTPSGRVTLTTHDRSAATALVAPLARAIISLGVGVTAYIPRGASSFHYAYPGDDVFVALLRRAGLRGVRVHGISFRCARDDKQLWETVVEADPYAGRIVESQPRRRQQSLKDAFRRHATTMRDRDGVTVPIAVKLAVGTCS